MISTRNGRALRRTALAALLIAAPGLGGCFGSFSLVQKVYVFNRDVSHEKWVREGVFLLLNIPFVPIYSIAAALDALFFNAVEFWTGDSLLADSAIRSVVGPHGEIAQATFHADGRADLVILEPDGTRHELTIERVGHALVARDPAGALLADSSTRP